MTISLDSFQRAFRANNNGYIKLSQDKSGVESYSANFFGRHFHTIASRSDNQAVRQAFYDTITASYKCSDSFCASLRKELGIDSGSHKALSVIDAQNILQKVKIAAHDLDNKDVQEGMLWNDANILLSKKYDEYIQKRTIARNTPPPLPPRPNKQGTETNTPPPLPPRPNKQGTETNTPSPLSAKPKPKWGGAPAPKLDYTVWDWEWDHKDIVVEDFWGNKHNLDFNKEYLKWKEAHPSSNIDDFLQATRPAKRQETQTTSVSEAEAEKIRAKTDAEDAAYLNSLDIPL